MLLWSLWGPGRCSRSLGQGGGAIVRKRNAEMLLSTRANANITFCDIHCAAKESRTVELDPLFSSDDILDRNPGRLSRLHR